MSATVCGEIDTTEQEAHDLACEVLYRYLSVLLSDPRASQQHSLLFDHDNQAMVTNAGDLLRQTYAVQCIALGYGELPSEDLDVRPLLKELGQLAGADTDEYFRVFGLVLCRECPPYETEYTPNDDTFYRSQQMADIAGFYSAFGVHPGSGQHERPDHLALELEFAALLLMRERQARQADTEEQRHEQAHVCREARAAFVRDHLAWWVPSFSLALRHKAERGLYEQAGRLLAAFLPIERTRLTIQPPALPILQPTTTEPTDSCEGCAASGPQ